MKQIIRELKRQVAGEKLEPEQLKGLIRAGYVYRSGSAWRLPEGGTLAARRSNIDYGEQRWRRQLGR
jgi:hypothetical protein